MSYVDNVILKASVFEGKAVAQLNTLFESGVPFTECDDESLPHGWYAGTKCLECTVMPGSFNYLDRDKLIEAIRQTSWDSPECVQLLIQGQEEDKFSNIELGMRPKEYGLGPLP